MSVMIGRVAKCTWDTWGLSPEQIISFHTLFPYYARFSPAEKICEGKRSLINAESHNLLAYFGVVASNLRPQMYFRFCKECRKADLQEHAETYWRRLHQIPGVCVCPKHKIALTDSRAYMRNVSYPFYLDATHFTEYVGDLSAISLNKRYYEKSVAVACRCEEILQITDQGWRGDNLFKLYRQEAISKGYVRYFDRLDLKSLESAFEAHWGVDFLNEISCNYKSGQNSWFRKALVGKLKSYQPILHILMQIFFDNLPNRNPLIPQIGFGPWRCLNLFCDSPDDYPIKRVDVQGSRSGIRHVKAECCCGYKFTFSKTDKKDPRLPMKNMVLDYGHVIERLVKDLSNKGTNNFQITKQTGLTSCAVRRSLTRSDNSYNISEEQIKSRRQAWLSILDSTPNRSRHVAAQTNRELFHLLRTRDYVWLYSTPAAEEKTDTKGKKVLKTPKYEDSVLIEMVKSAVKEMQVITPPKQLSKTQVLVWAGVKPTSILHRQQSFPLTMKYIDDHYETSEMFINRKLEYAVKIIYESDESLTLKNVMRLARVSMKMKKYAIGKLNDLECCAVARG